MQIKSILAGAAIALAATVGSASAADQFSTLDGLAAKAMPPHEMRAIIGAVVTLTVAPEPDPLDFPFDVIAGNPHRPAESRDGQINGLTLGLTEGPLDGGGGVVEFGNP